MRHIFLCTAKFGSNIILLSAQVTLDCFCKVEFNVNRARAFQNEVFILKYCSTDHAKNLVTEYEMGKAFDNELKFHMRQR